MPGTFYSSIGVTSRDYKYINNSVKIKDSVFSGDEILLFEDNAFTGRRFYPSEQAININDIWATFIKRSRIMWYYTTYVNNTESPIWFRAVTVMQGNPTLGYENFSKRHVLLERPFSVFNASAIRAACVDWVQNIFDNGGRRDNNFSLYIQLYIPCNGFIEPPHIASLVNTSYQALSPTWEAEVSYETHYTRWYNWGNLTSYAGLYTGWNTIISNLGVESFFGSIYKYINTDVDGRLWGRDFSTYSPFTLWTSWWGWFSSLFTTEDERWDFLGANLYLEEKGRIFKKPISPIRGFKYQYPNRRTLYGGGQYPQIFGSVTLVHNDWNRFDLSCPQLGNPPLDTIWNFMQDSNETNSYNNLSYEPVSNYQKLTYRMTQSPDVITVKQSKTTSSGPPNYDWEVIDSRSNPNYLPHDPFNLNEDYIGYAERYNYGGGLNLTPYSAACFIVQLCGDIDLAVLNDELNLSAEAYSGHLPQISGNPTNILYGFVVSAEYYDLDSLLDALYRLPANGIRVWQGHYFKLALFPDKATSLVYTLPAEVSKSLLGGSPGVNSRSHMLGALLTFKDERMTIPVWSYSRLTYPSKAPTQNLSNMNSAEIRLGNLVSGYIGLPRPYDKKGFFNKMRPGNVEMRFCTFKPNWYTVSTNMNSESPFDQNRNEFGRLADKKLILKRYGKNLTFHVVLDKSPSDVLLPQSIEISYPV
jgi:hypothetical protein